jgi:hypothetical protein
MKNHINDEVSAAFEILLECVESEANKLNELGAEAFRKRDHQKARELADQAEKFTAFHTRVLNLSTEWTKLNEGTDHVSIKPDKGVQKRSFVKLRKGTRTPEAVFYKPILEVLAGLGGRGGMTTVLDKVHSKVRHLLKPVDHQPLPSGPKSNLRWRNTAQWARNTLKEEGYLKKDSPHGVWEITDAGRNQLEML